MSVPKCGFVYPVKLLQKTLNFILQETVKWMQLLGQGQGLMSTSSRSARKGVCCYGLRAFICLSVLCFGQQQSSKSKIKNQNQKSVVISPSRIQICSFVLMKKKTEVCNFSRNILQNSCFACHSNLYSTKINKCINMCI